MPSDYRCAILFWVHGQFINGRCFSMMILLLEKTLNHNKFHFQIYDKQVKPPGTLADHGRAFADEALQLLESERNYRSITLIQGLALLWVYEGNGGNKSPAVDLLKELYHIQGCLGLSTITVPTGA